MDADSSQVRGMATSRPGRDKFRRLYKGKNEAGRGHNVLCPYGGKERGGFLGEWRAGLTEGVAIAGVA